MRRVIVVIISILILALAASPALAANMFKGGDFLKFKKALEAKVGKPIKTLSVLVFPNRARVMIQDPKKPENVDAYIYQNGRIRGPIPVRLVGSGNLEINLFKLGEVAWAALPDMVKKAEATFKDYEGMRVTHFVVRRGLPFTKNIRLRLFVSGTRKRGWIDFDAKGKVTKVTKR